jgi:hypothetical protein
LNEIDDVIDDCGWWWKSSFMLNLHQMQIASCFVIGERKIPFNDFYSQRCFILINVHVMLMAKWGRKMWNKN